MRYAVIADVHANLEALEAVLKEIKKRKIEEIFFLGDAVGYGANPNECIEVLKEEIKALIAGNHDWAVIGLTDVEYFNPYAREAVEWTKEVLTAKNKAFLKSLPLFVRLKDKDAYLVHATPKEPVEWNYLFTTLDAYKNFHYFTEKICFIGHSHQPVIIELTQEGDIIVYQGKADIKEKHRYIVNVGSVGQSRDGNPDAAYAVFDKNSIEIKRVSYDILSAQKKMREAGLPSYLVNRLSMGR